MKRSIGSARADFVMLDTVRVYGKPLCYLDSAATAQKPQAVIDAVNRAHTELNANVHRGVHYLAEQMTGEYEGARDKVQKFLGVGSSREVVFTSGATAGLNLLAFSLGEMLLTPGKNVVVSEIEHHSNIVPWQLAVERHGAELRYIPMLSDSTGLEDAEGVIDENTVVVSVTEASNVLGVRPDLHKIIKMAQEVGAVVVVDGCQGVVHSTENSLTAIELGADFYVFSGHKLYAPTGVGVLWGREELLERMPPYMGGGDMISRVSLRDGSQWAQLPLKFEAGTQNFVGAVGLGAAIDYLGQFDPAQIETHEMGLYTDFVSRLKTEIEGVRVYGDVGGRGCVEQQCRKAPVCSFTIEGVSSYDLASIVDKMGVAVRSGQLCAEPLMDTLGVRTMTRASWALYNNQSDNDQAIEAIKKAVGMLRR